MSSLTDVRMVAESDDDWNSASRVLQALSETYEPARPLSRGVWHHFRGSRSREVPVTLGVWLAGDVERQAWATLAATAPPHLLNRFTITVEDDAGREI